jgi:ribosome biogenesis protein Nip4
VFNMSDVPLVSHAVAWGKLSSFARARDEVPKRSEYVTDPQGFGATARSTLDTRKLDPSGIVVFHQADVGEFLRDEDTMF